MSKLPSLLDTRQFLVGFDRAFDELEKHIGGQNKYPPHDVIKVSEREYNIVLAVAGFTKSDIELTLEDHMLVIKGAKIKTVEDYETRPVYLYNGISNRAFTKTFKLSETLKVISAKVEDGLLTIRLEEEIPDEKKPVKISIQ